MKIRYIPLFLLFVVPSFCIGQYWKHTVTGKYQAGVVALPFIDPPVYDLLLPVSLPLVFHVVFPRESDNIPSLEDIEWQVQQLNRHFSLEEFYDKQAIYGESDFDIVATNTEISFCLSNIFFLPSDSTSFSGFNTIKSDLSWGANPLLPEEYINIWVGELDGHSGYAQRPGGTWETDGIVIDINFFGPQPIPYNEGKTLTHLMGNYLGLKDLWGESYCEDDDVYDTPIHNAPNYNKINLNENHISLCPDFSKEMHMNYMDNSIDSMLYMFTHGQKRRMHNFLKNHRNELLATTCSQYQPRIVLKNEPYSSDFTLNVFPNPANDFIHIEYRAEYNEETMLSIFNVVGEVIYQDYAGSSFSKSLNIKDWNSGIYFLSINGLNNYSVKFVKQ